MRVLQLGPYPPPHGGVQSNLVALRRFLRKQGIPCAVINITRHRKAEEDEVYYPRNALDLLRLLLRLRYDIIHLHIGGMLTRRLLRLAYVCSIVPGTRSVITFHSGGYPSTVEGRQTQATSLAGFVFRHLDALIGVNPEIMNFFVRLGVRSERMHLIYPHALLEEESGEELPEPLRSFLEGHRPVLISVGLLEPEYQLGLQIDVLERVRRVFPGSGLIIIGSGSLEGELRKNIESKPYGEHILLTGDVPHSMTIDAIRKSHVMLRTTLYDGDAVSVRESLYVGTPVIASDNGMRPASVRLIPKSDGTMLEKAILETLAEKKPPRPPASKDDSNLRAVLDLYRQLLAPGSKR